MDTSHDHPQRPDLLLDMPATAENVAGMRRRFASWLALDLDPGDLLDDVVLAVYEALANAAEHAYANAPAVGVVRLVAHRARDAVAVTVTDCGRWREATGQRFRNHGLDVIRQLIEHVQIASGDRGTVVQLRTTLPAPPTR
jgi:serine/threonine-protein kinase RsbW